MKNLNIKIDFDISELQHLSDAVQDGLAAIRRLAVLSVGSHPFAQAGVEHEATLERKYANLSALSDLPVDELRRTVDPLRLDYTIRYYSFYGCFPSDKQAERQP